MIVIPFVLCYLLFVVILIKLIKKYIDYQDRWWFMAMVLAIVIFAPPYVYKNYL